MIAAFPGICLLLIATMIFSPSGFAADNPRIKQRADAVLTLMSYMVVPDVTASDLNIGTGSNESNELTITQFGGGATPERVLPDLP